MARDDGWLVCGAHQQQAAEKNVTNVLFGDRQKDRLTKSSFAKQETQYYTRKLQDRSWFGPAGESLSNYRHPLVSIQRRTQHHNSPRRYCLISVERLFKQETATGPWL